MEIILPLPPSVNASTRNVRGVGRVKSGKYRAWLRAADALYLSQKRGISPVTGRCVLRISVPAAMRGDVSNRIKAIEDFLVSRELTDDDRHNWSVTIERDEGVPAGQCRVVAVAKIA